MRKRVWKKLTALALALVLCVQLLPVTALASLLDNEPDYNREILSMLADVVGSEEEAELYYALLQQYGLLDEDGSEIDSWEIEMDGEPVTLADIQALLADPDCDLTQSVTVDGSSITLGDLQTILEIEAYIAYLRETYFDGHQWTAEQLENLDDLISQISTEGISFFSADGADTGSAADDGRAPSGVYHDVTASVTVNEVTEDHYTFTVSLSKAQTVDVTFEYWEISGSWNAFAVLKAGVIEAGETTATFRVENENDTGSGIYSGSSKVNGTATAVLRLCSLKNALFENGRANYSTVLTINSTYGFSSTDTTATATISGPEPGSDFNAAGVYLLQEKEYEKTEEGLANWLIDTTLLANYRLEFYPGDIIPIVVTFSCPMQITADMTLNVNNRELHPYSAEVGNTANTCMFPYVVDEADATYLQFADVTDSSTYKLSGKGAGGQDVTVTIKYADDTDTGTTSTGDLTENASADRVEKLNAFIEANPKFFSSATVAKSSKLECFTIVTPVKSDAITGLSATLENPTTAPVIQVTAEVSDNENLTTWLLNDLKQSEGGSGFETQTLQVSIDGGKTLYPLTTTAETLTGGTLTASIPLELNMTAAEKTYTVELYLDDYKVDISGQYYVPFGELVLYQPSSNGESADYIVEWPFIGFKCLDFPIPPGRTIYQFSVSDDYKITIEHADTEDESEEITDADEIAAVDYPRYLYDVDGTEYRLEYRKDYETNESGDTVNRLVIECYDEDAGEWVDADIMQYSHGEFTVFLFKELYFYEDGTLYCSSGGKTAPYTSSEPVAVYCYGSDPLEMIYEHMDTWLILSNFYYVNQDGVMGNGVIYGKSASVTQAPVKFIESLDAPTLKVLDAEGESYESGEVDGQSVIYLQDNPKITASFASPGTGYSFGDTDKVTAYKLDPDTNVYVLEDPAAHFAWSSSDPTVANIDADGNITPTGKAGTVYFTITALNGGVEGKAVSASSSTLTFGAGLTPFLNIPNDKLESVSGQALTLFWTSNISDKNGEAETAFDVTVTVPKVNESSGETEEETVWSTTVTGTASAPAASVTIPGDVLTYTYGGASNTFTVTVSATYAGQTYSAQATIELSSQPAVVTLDKLDSYYITDTAGSVNIEWNVENFDRFSSANASDLFKFEVTQNGQTVASGTAPGEEVTANSGHYTGSCTLTIPGIPASASDPTSYRQVYTVTIQAKNGSDSTWSYDSFLLYVYDEDALKIWVSGKDQSSVTLSNVAEISQMSSADILALKRDIYLKDIISVNYGEYAWSEIADQIAWASGDNSVATVNYQQGTLYENIENFTYVSYRPTTEFGLSGISDGTATITATHKLTGIRDTLTVNVETLKDKLYLLQCYPQTTTTLSYTNGDGKAVTVETDETGAIAIYEENGIASDVYCAAQVDGTSYLGTFYLSTLETGEGDWTKLSRYPCNNLTLRQAAYAYLYVKKPDGTPYQGDITFRGGVYINGTYLDGAYFQLNGGEAGRSGAQDQTVKLGSDGLLTVTMDQTQWEKAVGKITARTDISYVFEIKSGNDEYYPMLLTVDANVNQDTFVGSGEAIVNFRGNDSGGKHPFVAMQASYYTQYRDPVSLLDETGKIGPTDSLSEAVITTAVMWWGVDGAKLTDPTVQLMTQSGIPVADGAGEYTVSHTSYPFVDETITQYTVYLNETSLDGVLDSGESSGVYLNYYADGSTLTRRETLPFQLCNMLSKGKVEESVSIKTQLQNIGQYMGTDASGAKNMGFGDRFVSFALDLVSTDSYSTGDSKLFRIQIAPTSDPTKFLGFIEVNIGNMNDKDQVTGVYAQTDSGGKPDFDYSPGLNELMTITGKRSLESYYMDDWNKVKGGKGVRNLSMQLGGYAESLIYYDENTGNWEIQILNGGFNVGGGVSYTWNWNFMVGPIPVTVSVTAGGTAEVSMDALTVSYYNTGTYKQEVMDYYSLTAADEIEPYYGIGNDFLTELRLYLYVRAFAGIGVDYAIIALKLGIYGQISLDMQFQWLNRPYMDESLNEIYNVADGSYNDMKLTDNSWYYGTDSPYYEEWYEAANGKLNGQHFKIDGQLGLEFVIRFLFFSYEWVLYSYNFNLLNRGTGQWDTIQTNWEKNSAAQQEAINSLLKSGSLSMTNVAGTRMLSLNLAPTLEDVSYLEEGSFWNDGSIALMALDDTSAMSALQYNSYAYANPLYSDDGELVVYLGVGLEKQDGETGLTVEDVHAYYGVKNEAGSYEYKGAIDGDDSMGDSQVSLAGTGSFAVAAWTRQTASIDKDNGAVLTDDDQMIMMNGSEIYAGIYNGSGWSTTRLTEDSTADLAPVVATNGKSGADARAIVAWRSVAASGKPVENEEAGASYTDVTNFDEKDVILYRIYDGSKVTGDNNGWSGTQTLYNGTSGAVKGIVAAMMDDGTAAVAYALDTDKDSSTITDREIYLAVVDNGVGNVTKTVRASNDAYLDENPQLTVAAFPSAGDQQRFVLGWYTEQAVSTDDASTLDAGDEATTNQTTADIRLMDFDGTGTYTQLLPDSISSAATDYDVAITSTFRFTKNSGSINDLSILWVERAEGTAGALEDGADGGSSSKDITAVSAERDVLKGVKFYTYGEKNEIVTFTGAIDVAEMGEGTLIDHFDAYVSDAENNEIKAVILGTTYGADGATTQTGVTVNGETVQYTVPSKTTSMFTATETYADKIDVPALLADYDTVKLGAATQILFTVKNNGIHAISKLEIDVGGTTTTYGDLNLLPGSTIQIYADYTVPADGVIDPAYTVKATFNSEGASGGAATTASVADGRRSATTDLTVAKGTVYLDLPDVEITDARIVSEVDGERTIQLKLNNDSDAVLNKSGRSVKISFYTDSAYQNEFPKGYGLDAVTVEDAADLAMLDKGGYSVQVTFKVQEYLNELADDGEAPTEIPDNGIMVYVKAEALEETEPDSGDSTSSLSAKSLAKARAMTNAETETTTLPEPVVSNNFAAVTAENLKTRTGQDVTITSNLDVTDSGTTVTVELQNTRLSQITTGNVIVTVLDADKNVLGQQQCYTGSDVNNGLITLGNEEKRSMQFTFADVTDAASVQVTYSDLILGADSVDLTSLSFDGISGIGLDSFTKDENGVYRAAVSTDDLTSTVVYAVTESSKAEASAYANSGIAGDGSNALSQWVTLNPGETNTITVTVVNGTQSRTYVLTVQNNGEPVVTWPDETNALEAAYGTEVYYAADQSATINLTASATPDKEENAYQISYQWYSCGVDGSITAELPDETASTLSIPSTTDAGVYYYRCEIIRHLVNNSTTSYWSSVASVQINKAGGNSVTLEGTEATFDNGSHKLTRAAAAKEGSTIYYSTDGGKTWSETEPTFTSVGVHTVWVYAANPNYEDTGIMTADVVIQEKSGTLFKLETQSVAELYDSYPAAVRELYGDADSLSSALTEAMKKMGVSEQNMAAYGSTLMFSLDGGETWTQATAENLPAAGMTVTIPYPDGTNRSSYNFILKQLVTDPLNSDKTVGDMDAVDITLTEDGISFTADCLSALVLGWQPRSTSDSKHTVAAEDAEHGTFTVSPSRAAYNSTVTITAKPDEGYQVGSVTVTT